VGDDAAKTRGKGGVGTVSWQAVYDDGTRVESPHYGRIDRSRPFRFELFEYQAIRPFLSIPVGKGWRLVHRTRHRVAPGVEFPPQTIVAVESEDRSTAQVWVIEQPPLSQRLNGYTGDIYPPELFDFESVNG
jgi:hypothetical protein